MSKLRKFSEVTTIHGLYYALKKIQPGKYHTYVWSVIICLATILCLWQNIQSVQQYLSYDVTTTTYYEHGKQLTYPALTFWSKNNFKRTVIGRPNIEMMTAVLLGGDSDGVARLYYQINKTCYHEPPSRDEVDDKISNLDIGAMNSAPLDMILGILDFAIVNKTRNFLKCYWKNIETDCESILLTTVIDTGQGFSFNLDRNVVQNFIGNKSGLGPQNKKYTSNTKYFVSLGIDNGLKFILNVNQDEYCDYTSYSWYGAGFQLKFHDPKTLPSDLFGTSITLTAGYQYNIAIIPTQHFRNTEHLGKCISSYPMYMFPGSDTYMKELCHIQCENELVWQRCGCLSTLLRQAAIAFAEHHKIDENKMALGCIGEYRACLSEMADEGSKEGIDNLCPQCKQPCEETEYNYQMTVMQFPPDHLLHYYYKELNVSNEASIKRNFLMVNIHFESSLTQLLIENQMFTARDMFIYIGNSIGLFLGMSFMSFAEILTFLLELIQNTLKKAKLSRLNVRRKTRVKTIKLNQKPKNCITSIIVIARH